MTPQEFIKKWRPVALTERQAAQEHFIDLCRLMGHPTPVEADPTGETYCFEKGALKSSGNPDRILPKDQAAAAILAKRTLTNLYNERPQWLADAHETLDRAVAAAYMAGRKIFRQRMLWKSSSNSILHALLRVVE
jgi:hypothetical protein